MVKNTPAAAAAAGGTAGGAARERLEEGGGALLRRRRGRGRGVDGHCIFIWKGWGRGEATGPLRFKGHRNPFPAALLGGNRKRRRETRVTAREAGLRPETHAGAAGSGGAGR